MNWNLFITGWSFIIFGMIGLYVTVRKIFRAIFR